MYVARSARTPGARLDRVEGAAAFGVDGGTHQEHDQAPYHRLLHYLAGGDSPAARWRFYRLPTFATGKPKFLLAHEFAFDELGVVLCRDEFGMLEDSIVERGGRKDAVGPQFC